MLISINISRNKAFLMPGMLFFLFKKVEMPKLMAFQCLRAGKISCSAELSMKFFITSRPGFIPYTLQTSLPVIPDINVSLNGLVGWLNGCG